MTTSTTRAALACALLATTCLSLPASSQTGPNPPPRKDSVSPTGVSYHSGAFAHQEQDLAIGGGAFPTGLTLTRSYLSSLDQVIAAYSGVRTQGWSDNLVARVGNTIVEVEGIAAPQGQEAYLYSVTIGSRSVGFKGGSAVPTGGFVGEYEPIEISGDILEFGGGDHSSGRFTFTEPDGTTLYFNSLSAGAAALAVATLTAPDGTKLEFNYGAFGLASVISNRGYALLFEYSDVPGGRARTKACTVNMAATYVSSTSACPPGAQTVTYQYSSSGNFSSGPILTGFTDTTGQATSYGYDARGHLNCITMPGQSGCRISNTYGLCYAKDDPDTPYPENPPGYRWHEPVLSQRTATGESYSYSFPASQQCPRDKVPVQTTMTDNVGAATTVATDTSGGPTSITDPLKRVTTMDYVGQASVLPGIDSATLSGITRPEGDKSLYLFDARGNVTEERTRAKPGSGEGDIVRTANYPESCTNRKTCNKPIYAVDARLNRVDFTYSPDHGGVLTETGFTVNGIRPQKRYSYAQRYAWVKNASGALVQAASPIWVLAQESFCKTGASSGAGCAIAGDEVITLYDYGPDGVPNNLLLRGIVTDARVGGLNLRTCYAYDQAGNKVSETSPRAGLTSCQ